MIDNMITVMVISAVALLSLATALLVTTAAAIRWQKKKKLAR